MQSFVPFPNLKSGRLSLREISPDDAPVIFYLRSDEEITRYIERPEDRKTKSLEDADKFIRFLDEALYKGDSITWAICEYGSDKMIGSICLWNFSEDGRKGEIGYDLAKDFQGKGYMNEAMKLVLDYGFEALKLETIEAFTDYRNRGSIRLLERNGFELQESRRDSDNANNRIFVRRSLIK